MPCNDFHNRFHQPVTLRNSLKMGRLPLWQGEKVDCGCQDARITAIPAVDADCGYFPASHKILSCRDSCCTV